MTTPDRRPLAARMRPKTLEEVVGQGHLVYPGSPLELVAQGRSSASLLLYGPPGTGKTSIASVVAKTTDRHFVELSATSAGVKEVRDAISRARKTRAEHDEGTVLFIDEIHRFSKAQQDILLPAVEDGTISLIGATTENPSFSVNPALISRSMMLVLRVIEREDVVALLRRALENDEQLSALGLAASDEVLTVIADLSSGDVRQGLGRLENVAATASAAGKDEIDIEAIEQVTGRALQRYDRDGDQHYDIISAFIKSMRGSDPQGALHWMARMLEAGEDPRYVARRIVVHASEDVGMADPSVLPIAVAAAQAVQLIGMPEAQINLAHAVIAIATAPKSPGVIAAIGEATADVRAGRTGEVPMHLRDAHYPGAKALGHGAGYLYPHDYPHGIVDQEYLPDRIRGTVYYRPTDNGFERTVSARMAVIDKITTEQREGAR